MKRKTSCERDLGQDRGAKGETYARPSTKGNFLS